jgi:hypothetical protein
MPLFTATIPREIFILVAETFTASVCARACSSGFDPVVLKWLVEAVERRCLGLLSEEKSNSA